MLCFFFLRFITNSEIQNSTRKSVLCISELHSRIYIWKSIREYKKKYNSHVYSRIFFQTPGVPAFPVGVCFRVCGLFSPFVCFLIVSFVSLGVMAVFVRCHEALWTLTANAS
jgi:hypothetical protein